MPVVQSASGLADARPSLEDHLRQIIELQPVCLSRIGTEGTFLAVNEGALAMLGGERLDQVLETSFFNVVAPEQRQRCREFLGRFDRGERRSAEFDITGLDQVRRLVQVQAVSLANPLDGIPSALCSFRDVSEHRRLERTVVETAARADEASAAHAERERLSALLEQEHQDAMSRALADHATRTSELERQLADAEARETALAVAAVEQQQELDELRRTIADRQEALEEATEHGRRLAEVHEAERADWNPKAADLERQLVAAVARETALAAEGAEQQRELIELRRAAATYRAALEEATEHSRRLAATHAAALARTAELEQQRASAATRETALAAAAAEQEREVVELRRAVSNHEAALKEELNRAAGWPRRTRPSGPSGTPEQRISSSSWPTRPRAKRRLPLPPPSSSLRSPLLERPSKRRPIAVDS